MFRKMVFSSGLMAVALLLWAGTAGAAPEIHVAAIDDKKIDIGVRLIDNTGTNTPVDIHIGVSIPGAYYYELDRQLTPHLLSSDPALSYPLIKNIIIPAGTDTGWVTVFNYSFTGNEPGGNYTVFAAATETGTYNVLSSDIKSVTYTPPATPLPTMTLACVGVKHEVGFSYINVCVNLTNVPSGSKNNNFTGLMGSTSTPVGYQYTYSSDGNYLTKICTKFKITQYDAYSGMVGITTSGGSVALNWDINVTSAPVACQ